MNKELQSKAIFVSFCIEQYAKAKRMNTEEVALMFEKHGVTEHFDEFFDVLHTQGKEWLIEEIDEFIDRRTKQ